MAPVAAERSRVLDLEGDILAVVLLYILELAVSSNSERQVCGAENDVHLRHLRDLHLAQPRRHQGERELRGPNCEGAVRVEAFCQAGDESLHVQNRDLGQVGVRVYLHQKVLDVPLDEAPILLLDLSHERRNVVDYQLCCS